MHFLEGVRRVGWVSFCVLSAQASRRVMQWRASVSKALLLLLGVLVDSATRSTESLSISEWLFSNSWRERSLHCSVFSVHWQSHLLPMNGCVVRRRSPPPPPPEFYSRQITCRSWESTTTWRLLNYIMLLLYYHFVCKHVEAHFCLVLLSLRQQM